MADGVQFSPATATIGGSTTVLASKRKYEDRRTTSPPPPPSTRRPSGFSSAPTITSSSPDSANVPPPSYTSVPPPMDDIQIAKQRAQEIAARIFNSVDPKRPRTDNDQRLPFSNFNAGTGGYGYQGTSKKMEIPNNRVGVIIGKSGETVKYLQLQSGAKIQITRDMDADPNSQSRLVELMGTQEQIDKAEQLVNDVLAEAEAGASSLVNKRVNAQAGSESFVMKIPNNRVGLVIGKGGETIKNMQATTGARIQVIPLHLPPGDTSTERTIQIDGTSDQIESAQQMVTEVISENRLRNQSNIGYVNNHQAYQQGYQQLQPQQQPPTNWANPPPTNQHQPAYGYTQQQPAPFSAPPPQYNPPPQPSAYSAYPPQPPSSGYSTPWDITNQNPQSNPGGGYDYYTQQPQTTAPSYTYSQQQQQQQPIYSQPQTYPNNAHVYGQQQNPISTYDQQSYNNTYTNSGGTGQTQDVNSVGSYGGTMTVAPTQSPAAPHGYGGVGGGGTQQTSPNTGYGNQAQMMVGQGGYGYGSVSSSQAQSQAQAPKVSPAAVPVPGYGQSQASPGGQGGGGYMNPSAVYTQPMAIPPPVTHQQISGYGQAEAGGAPHNYNGGYGSGYGGPPLSLYGHQQMAVGVPGSEKIGGGSHTVPSP